jgi:hypothetical protein
MTNLNKFTNSEDKKNIKYNIENQERLSQVGKTPEEMLPYHLSGEPDDLSFDFFDEI